MWCSLFASTYIHITSPTPKMCEQQIERSARQLGFCPALLDLVLEQSPIFKRICQGCIISRRRVFRGKRAPDFQLFQPVSRRAVLTVTNNNNTIQR